ncbi:MAG TPA: hypothetical protein VGP68_02345 [Gemmataceae bacterium]|jgi:hypothetical protein|nr:hypothetical protein [Gemmataceae bacterium]
MTPNPLEELLVDLGKKGIKLRADGERLRFRPMTAVTPNLAEQLKANKAELLRLIDGKSFIGELRQAVELLWRDAAWRSAWERRLTKARFAKLDTLRRVLESIIQQVEEHHRRQDWVAIASTCKYLRSMASGQIWDTAERLAIESTTRVRPSESGPI